MKSPLISILPAAVTLLLGATEAPATELRYVSVADLAARADACVVARVRDARTEWSPDGRFIVTIYTMEPVQVLSGDVPSAPFALTRLGGEKDGIALGYAGMPRLDVGETAALLLVRRAPGSYIVAALSQGILRQRDGGYERDLSGVEAAPGPRETWTPEELAATIAAARAAGPLSREGGLPDARP